MNFNEAQNTICNVSLTLDGIVRNGKIEQEAKNELEGISTTLYYYGTKKAKNGPRKAVLSELKDVCLEASSSITQVVKTFEIEGKDGELLEDVSNDLLIVSAKFEAKPKKQVAPTNIKTLDEFI